MAGACTRIGGGRVRRSAAASSVGRVSSSPSGVRMAAWPKPATTAEESGQGEGALHRMDVDGFFPGRHRINGLFRPDGAKQTP